MNQASRRPSVAPRPARTALLKWIVYSGLGTAPKTAAEEVRSCLRSQWRSGKQCATRPNAPRRAGSGSDRRTTEPPILSGRVAYQHSPAQGSVVPVQDHPGSRDCYHMRWTADPKLPGSRT
eukprot:9494158-Pyramimonas_sp.AAC.1